MQTFELTKMMNDDSEVPTEFDQSIKDGQRLAQANETYGFKVLNLSEEPLDCKLSLDVCDERKNQAKNQMVLVLREENIMLKNMTCYYQERELGHANENSSHMEMSMSLEIAQDLEPNHLSMMRKLARKFNDKTTCDFVVKCQVFIFFKFFSNILFFL